MKINKRFLSLFLIALLTVALVACGSTTQAPTTTENTTTTEATTAETTTAVDLEALLEELAGQYADTLASDTFVATDDINLVSSIGGYDVTWSSNNTTYLENDGTIHRPSFTTGNQTVVLTASITDGTVTETYNFFVTISALAKTDQERANEVFSIVVTFPNKEKWTAADNDDLVFLTEGEDADGVTYDVVWTSSAPEVMSTDGTITQPEDADVEVTMTAAITINGVTYTDTYTFTVAKLEEGTPVSSIAEAAALGEGSYVNIQGVTVIAKYPSGSFFVTDGTDILLIYGATFSVEVGSVYDVSGVFIYYYNSPELKGEVTQPLKVEASTAEVSEAPIAADTNIAGLVSGMTTPTPENPFAYEKYTITGKVWYDETLGNYSLFIVPSDYDFSADLDDATKPNGDALMIYYQSNMDILIPFEGKEITIDVITLGWRTDKSVWYAGFFGTLLDVDITIADDTEAVSTALDALTYPETIVEDTTLSFPTNLYGVDLTYSSDNVDVISNTGVVDFSSQTTQVTVTLTITATRGTVTDTKEVVIKVGILPISTIAEAIEAGDGTTVKVIGIITGTTDNAAYGAYWLQDSTGAFDLFNPSGLFTEDMIGKTFEITGEVDVYHGLYELKVESIDFVTEITGDDALTMPTAIDISELTLDDDTLLSYQGMLVDINGFVLKYDMEDSYTNTFNFTLVNFSDQEITVRIDKDNPEFDSLVAIIAGASAGSPFDFSNLIVGWYDGVQLLIGSQSAITEGAPIPDDLKLVADKNALDFGGTVYEATDIVLPETGSNGSTIVWTITQDDGSNATLTDGTLSLNAVTDDATVEITATLTLGTATDTAVFTYTLKNLVMVDLGDFASQTIGDVVTIHGNVYAVIGNGFFVEDETGKLFVFSYDATYNVGDEVELTGEVAQYKGSFQLSNLSDLPDAISTGNDVTQTPINYVDGTTVLEAGQMYRVVGTVAIEGTYNNVYIYINDTDKFEIYYKSPSDSIDVLKALEGKLIVVDMIYYNDDTVFVFTGTSDDAQEVVTDLSTLSAQTDGSWTIPNDTMIFAQGVITGFGYNVIYIQDDNGNGFAMYKAEGYNNDGTVNVGDKVIYYGKLDDYPGTRQFSYGADLVAVLSTGNTVISTTMTLDELIGLTLQDGGKVITVTGLKIISFDDGGKMIFEASGTGEESTIILLEMYRNDSINWLEDVYNVNDVLGETTFVFVKFSGDNLRIELMQHEITDQQAVDAEIANMPTELILTDDLTPPTSELGVTIVVDSITGDAAAYIDYTTTPGTLLVTRPANGEGDKTGVINITVSKGDISETATINVTVSEEAAEGTITELFISEYAEGSGSNKWIEIYNGTGDDVDLSNYSIELYSNGSDTANYTLTLSGILAAGDVYVIYNSSADIQAVIDAGDITSTVTYFNGDDAVALLKDGTVIDVIGVIGTDPGSNWVVGDGSTADHTLVRDPSVTGPNATFTASEWIVYDQDTADYVGSHTVS